MRPDVRNDGIAPPATEAKYFTKSLFNKGMSQAVTRLYEYLECDNPVKIPSNGPLPPTESLTTLKLIPVTTGGNSAPGALTTIISLSRNSRLDIARCSRVTLPNSAQLFCVPRRSPLPPARIMLPIFKALPTPDEIPLVSFYH